MASRIQLTDEQRDVLTDPGQLPASLEVNGKTYTLGRVLGTGFKGVVWEVRDEHSRRRALKLTVYDDYAERSYLEEASRAASLDSYSVFADFVDADVIDIPFATGTKKRVVAFVEEWVNGHTLTDFLSKERESVSPAFMLAYVRGMAEALNALKAKGLAHDDLHASNVMLARPELGELSQEWSVKVIDTGSLKPITSRREKPKDDHRHFVDHLILIWNTIFRKRVLAVRDRRFLAEARGLLQSMLDDEPGIALREPAQIVNMFVAAHTRSTSPRPGPVVAPTSPFEFISAEHIADDRLLVDLFARSCPFLEKVDGPDPCVVTGPRGCGKSTIFRWLSLKAHLHKNDFNQNQFRIAGFYLSCSSDLQNKLGWITTDSLAKRFRREIIHYFNLLLTREILHTLCLISMRDDVVDAWGFGLSEEQAIWRFVVESLGTNDRPRVQGVSRLAQAIELTEAELFATYATIAKRDNVRRCTSESFLGDMTQLLVKHVPYFQSKRIAFLVDDFSAHRIPPPVQVILNRVIWERRPSHIFKLSSEKYGLELTDSHGGHIDVSREMVEIDCGREYVALDDSVGVKRAQRFATELLDNRLRAAGYRGNSTMLLGSSKWTEGSLGRALASPKAGRVLDQYHGIDCIANICSGDVSTLLLVFRRVFEHGNVLKDSTASIPRRTQHKAIVDVSRELFDSIRHHVPYGPEMHSVVGAFGALVRNVLQKGRWHKKGTGTVPCQCPRIELDQRGSIAEDVLTASQWELARELVRRAIFIEMEPGLSRHGNVTTLRWHMRRVYLPAFRAALAKNDAVKESIHWLKFFLTNPQEACERVWGRWPKALPDEGEPSLFSASNQVVDGGEDEL